MVGLEPGGGEHHSLAGFDVATGALDRGHGVDGWQPPAILWWRNGAGTLQRGKGGLMAPITSITEISRPAEDVFAYVTDPATMPEWQKGCVSGHLDGPRTRVGSKCTTVRMIGGREREATTEITEYDPPHRWADRGIDGPVRATVAVTVEPLADESRSRVTIDLDFVGHGIGKLLVPLIVRRQAASEMPENMKRLKQQLEARPPGR